MGAPVPHPNAAADVGDDPLLGARVLDYIVERRLGAGAHGAVYLLRHATRPSTFAALKVLAIDRSGGAARMRFGQEAMIAAAVPSARVVKPIEVGELDDGRPFIVMEYVDGRALDQALRERRALPVKDAVRIALDVAETMTAAHGAGIVHRDLKPSNLMLVGDGDALAVRVLDFGIARAQGELRLVTTAEHVVLGTPGYWTPEAVGGRAVDGRADVFALGVILFEMLTGTLPFAAPSPETAMLSVLTPVPAPRMSTRRPPDAGPIPEGVEALVARALEKSVEARIDMATFRDGLRVALDRIEAGVIDVAPPSRRAGTPVKRARIPRVILVGVAIVLAGGAGTLAWRLMRVKGPPPIGLAAVPPGGGNCPAGMRFVPGGTFMMGSPDGEGSPDERPAHRVTLSPYCLDEMEVSLEQYRQFETPPKEMAWPGLPEADKKRWSPDCNDASQPNLPIGCVTWDDARRYCAWRGRRLPTEAEWELSARGIEGRRFPWGDAEPDESLVNACGPECSEDKKKGFGGEHAMLYPRTDGWKWSSPVDAFPRGRGPFGHLNLAGNVTEWVADCYSREFYGTDAALGPDPRNDPGDACKLRVIRGGSWSAATATNLRGVFRASFVPWGRFSGIGIRCAAAPGADAPRRD